MVKLLQKNVILKKERVNYEMKQKNMKILKPNTNDTSKLEETNDLPIQDTINIASEFR